MGEKKRKDQVLTPYERALHLVTKKLMSEGKIIEAGWVTLRANIISPTASEMQISDMRKAYMAGAQHLWASIMSGLDNDEDPTPADEERMRLIAKELDAFYEEMKRELAIKQGAKGTA